MSPNEREKFSTDSVITQTSKIYSQKEKWKKDKHLKEHYQNYLIKKANDELSIEKSDLKGKK